MQMLRFTIQLAPTQADALTALAARRDRSIAAEIRTAVSEHLDAAVADLNDDDAGALAEPRRQHSSSSSIDRSDPTSRKDSDATAG